MKSKRLATNEMRYAGWIPLLLITLRTVAIRKRSRLAATRWSLECLTIVSGPVGFTTDLSKIQGLLSFLSKLSCVGHTTHTMWNALLVLPLLGLCAVKASLPEELFNSQFRSRLGSVLSKHQSIADMTIHPMRRRPGSRHVFSYKLLVGDHRTGKQTFVELVGKRDTTQAAGKGAKEFEAMRLLWGAGFGQDNRFRIPQPLHHFEDLQLIIQEKARGTKLRTFLGDGSDTSFSHNRMAGLWLTKLHNMKVARSRICEYENEKASLRTFVEALRADQPQLECVLQDYATTIEQRFHSFRGADATHVHGDFHPDHIYVGNGFITVIDFERFCIGDPARDLGSFIAHMRSTAYSLGKSVQTVNQEIIVFLESYFNCTPQAERAAIRLRIAPFVVLSSIEALYYVASVLKVSNPTRIAMYAQCLLESELLPINADAPPSRAQTVSA